MIYVHMKSAKILKIHEIFMYFYDILGTQNGTQTDLEISTI